MAKHGRRSGRAAGAQAGHHSEGEGAGRRGGAAVAGDRRGEGRRSGRAEGARDRAASAGGGRDEPASVADVGPLPHGGYDHYGQYIGGYGDGMYAGGGYPPANGAEDKGRDYEGSGGRAGGERYRPKNLREYKEAYDMAATVRALRVCRVRMGHRWHEV